VVFISDFSAFNPDTGEVKDNILGIYGDKDLLIDMLEDLKRIVEDAADEDGFVNI
jgi:hypothetical protein